MHDRATKINQPAHACARCRPVGCLGTLKNGVAPTDDAKEQHCTPFELSFERHWISRIRHPTIEIKARQPGHPFE